MTPADQNRDPDETDQDSNPGRLQDQDKTYVTLSMIFIYALFVIPIIVLYFVDWLVSKSRSCFFLWK